MQVWSQLLLARLKQELGGRGLLTATPQLCLFCLCSTAMHQAFSAVWAGFLAAGIDVVFQ